MAGGIPFSFTFRDSKNQTASIHFYTASTQTTAQVETQIANMLTVTAALSNATTTRNQGAAAVAPVAGTAAQFDDVEDKAVLVFQTAAGALHRYSIAAPKATIFQADKETVDYSNTDVAAFVTQLLTGTTSRDGNTVTASVGGTRKRVKAQRRFNIRTRNPALTGQGL